MPVTLHHIYNPTMPEDRALLSPEQEEALRQAYHDGYFDVPRCETLVGMAEDFDISATALSQRFAAAPRR